MVDLGRRPETRKNVEILFGEPERQLRSNIRLAMRNEKFENVIDVENVGHVRQLLATRAPDLIIIDAETKGGSVSELIYDVRHGHIGENPFVPFIVTMWRPTEVLVQDVANSGTDDLLVKPVSPQQLVDRIKVLTENRKPFVVTSDYIGPDRRKDVSRGSDIPLIEVPNTLSVKISGEKMDPTKLSALVKRAQNTINDQRLKRNAFQICFLVGLILPALAEDRLDDPELEEHLRSVLTTSRDTAERMLGTEYEHVSNLCNNMIDVVERLLDNLMAPSTKDVSLLKPVSDAILLGFHPTSDAATMAGEINSALSAYDKRQKKHD
ncbi:response regulator [Hwanghaeella grinnelliae]|uniref:Response regulator n=1 Tax=Hwanghaeella grinnelliae TaxID=2500179 RepID=A0A3S2WQ41_9PROT|nr:response regulator [Hwanghaeella grinnelliae]RVU34752.1 response regulator [Hwanghaeella grinnelliae]